MKGNGRNKPCPCGSGKKHKVCLCWQIELAHEEALREHDFRKHCVGRGSSKVFQAVAIANMINAPFR